eukprot:Platyproteum_vivax@DN4224_c0_g1_i1.p1
MWNALVFVVLIIILIPPILWVVCPYYSRYRHKCNVLDNINLEYENLRKTREDVVFHYYWAVDRNDLKEAAQHEKYVQDLDGKCKQLQKVYHEYEDKSIFTEDISLEDISKWRKDGYAQITTNEQN